jgi:hypothetical protein
MKNPSPKTVNVCLGYKPPPHTPLLVHYAAFLPRSIHNEEDEKETWCPSLSHVSVCCAEHAQLFPAAPKKSMIAKISFYIGTVPSFFGCSFLLWSRADSCSACPAHLTTRNSRKRRMSSSQDGGRSGMSQCMFIVNVRML